MNEVVLCEQCRVYSLRTEVYAVMNPELHGKDVLFFCKDSECERLYKTLKEMQNE